MFVLHLANDSDAPISPAPGAMLGKTEDGLLHAAAALELAGACPSNVLVDSGQCMVEAHCIPGDLGPIAECQQSIGCYRECAAAGCDGCLPDDCYADGPHCRELADQMEACAAIPACAQACAE